MQTSRRTFLRGAGIAMSLPVLEYFLPRSFAGDGGPAIRRMVAICTPLGLHTPNLFPETTGKDYAPTPYLDDLKPFRDDMTVISGLSHPGVEMGHDSIYSFLTAAPHPERRAGFRNTISLDQFAAEKIGSQTRFPSLTLSAEGFSLSWTRSGALVPSDTSPARLFARMFLAGRPDEVAQQVKRLQDGQSILDGVSEQARQMQSGLGAADRDKLDQYFTSVRDLEKSLATSEQWSKKPKPTVDAKPPQDIANAADLVGRTRLLFDIAHLALQTDSTRLITIMLLGTGQVPPIAGVSDGHHNLSHHGKDPEKLRQLTIVEKQKLAELRTLLTKLKESKEQGVTLLDRTTVFFSSNLGNASSHSCRNLPVILAGGGFKHGQHLAFDPAKPPPMSNLFVSMLQRMGIEAEKFGSSTGTLSGLEMA